LLYINTTKNNGIYFETHGTINSLYTSILKPYIDYFDNKINIIEYTNNYNSNIDNVGAYLLYELERLLKNRKYKPNININEYRDYHFKLLYDIGIYNAKFNVLEAAERV
jgi:hypothetical protein